MSKNPAEVIEEHYSPDKFLRLIVTRSDDGDICIGFDGYEWHTHADIESEISGLPQEAAIRQFVDRITSGKQLIAVAKVAGNVQRVWPTDDPMGLFEFKPEDETIEFRRWNGEQVKVSPPDHK